jgi:hypothetical protein
MLNDDKKLALDNAFKAGVEQQRDKVLVYLAERVESHNHFMLSGRHCAICISWKQVLNFIIENPVLTECECDPCGNPECKCFGKRCDYCFAKDN